MESKETQEFSLEGEDCVEDSREREEDSKLFRGICVMDGFRADVMIKKGFQINKETYNMMRNFQHNSIIPHLNFYPDSNAGRLVIPMVKSSFESWIKNDGQRLLIDGNGNMSSLFKTIIIDICDVVEKLSLKMILITNLNWTNLYMAKEITNRILLLVSEAKTLGGGVSKIAIWTPVKEIIKWCYKECKARPNCHVERYVGFIGKQSFNVKSLKMYPENWDNYTKRDYLLSIIAANQGIIRSAMRSTVITWPRQHGKLPDLLEEIIQHQSNKPQPHYYNPNIPFDYVNLIRDIYKHFEKFPSHIKLQFNGSQEGFINMLEQWTPTFWADLFDVIGWL